MTPDVADGWRAILLRRPRWRTEREVHAEQAVPEWPAELLAELGEPEPGRVVVDLMGVDARPGADKAADAGDRAAGRRAGPVAGGRAGAAARVVAGRAALPAQRLRRHVGRWGR